MWSTTVTKFPYAALLPPPLLQREAAAHLSITIHMYTQTKPADGSRQRQNYQFNLIMICEEEHFAENFKSLRQPFVLDPMLNDRISVGQPG